MHLESFRTFNILMFKQFSFKNLGQNKAAGLATEMRYTAVKAKNVLHHS